MWRRCAFFGVPGLDPATRRWQPALPDRERRSMTGFNHIQIAGAVGASTMAAGPARTGRSCSLTCVNAMR
jgi:hypothetical protein